MIKQENDGSFDKLTKKEILILKKRRISVIKTIIFIKKIFDFSLLIILFEF